MAVRAHVIVRGRVQGVFYRQSTRDKSLATGVSGWVRNLRDGSVEAVFEGDPGSVKEMVSWCRRGPPTSRVEAVDVDWNEKPEGLAGYEVRY
ncbi:MAG: acylphosphatase [Candidatus Altiarchaeales archaeon]|nr:acylphosphatase [Candidatus Altiarchaeales archaeon]MBD3416218.1 acylphosphatase [Candidatus Altiarchaeales archaeon]